MKNLAYIIIIIIISSCTTISSDNDTKPQINEAFNGFIQLFPDIQLPYEILSDKGKEMEQISYEKSIQYLGIKWQDKDLGIPESETRAVGKFMLDDSTYCLLYRALELPVASGDNISYRLASFDHNGVMIDEQDIAKFTAWNGGYIEQTCTINSDKSISAHYELENETGEKTDVTEINIYQKVGVFETDEEPAGNPTEKIEIQELEFMELTKSDYPIVIKKDMVGQIIKGINWKDELGNNYIMVSTKKKKHGTIEDAMNHYLYVKHYVDTGKKFPSVLWETTDFVKECVFDNMLELVDSSISVTDLDNDNIAETVYMYTLGCVSDVSPYPLKLIMHEGETKMAIRGNVRFNLQGYPREHDYDVDEESFQGQPEIFKNFAIQHWKKYDLISY